MLTPVDLERPALVIVEYAQRESPEPIARIAVGPGYPVTRGVFFPEAGLDLKLHVFARHGEVRAEVEGIERARLWKGVGARLNDMRHLGVRSVAARAFGALKRMQGRTQVVGTVPLDPVRSVQGWLARYGTAPAETIARLQARQDGRIGRRVALLDARYADSVGVERSRLALQNQIGAHLDTVTLVNDKAVSKANLEKARTCDTLYWLEAGEEPVAHACLALDDALFDRDGMAFADCVVADSSGRASARFHVGWDAVRAAAGFELPGIVALRGSVAKTLISQSGERGLPARSAAINAAAAALGEDDIVHVPAPLTRVPATSATIRPSRPCDRPHWQPSVSLIIPTHARAELLSLCVASCFESMTYRPLELVVIDHASRGHEMAEALDAVRKRPGAIVVREEGPFNYSRLINVGVKQSSGEVIVLLNDDVEARVSDWLTQLVAMLDQPQVGIVGPRLLYPDGRIQHNGVALGMGGLPVTLDGAARWTMPT